MIHVTASQSGDNAVLFLALAHKQIDGVDAYFTHSDDTGGLIVLVGVFCIILGMIASKLFE